MGKKPREREELSQLAEGGEIFYYRSRISKFLERSGQQNFKLDTKTVPEHQKNGKWEQLRERRDKEIPKEPPWVVRVG